VGYSDNPNTPAAGKQAAEAALTRAGLAGPCDLVLLFATARHDQRVLRDSVASVTGPARIYGGGAVGIITNEFFGYAGDQIGVACIWLEGARCDVIIDDGLLEGEEETGVRLGKRLAAMGTTPRSPVMLFYDAIDRTGGDVRMKMATWLLAGLQKGLGFFPDLTGAGIMGDHACSPTSQWTGEDMSEHCAMALKFSGDVRIDSVIMHGCRPASQYYTITKAEGPVILEINGKPALRFMDELLGSSISVDEYPFFLLFGINRGERWGEYDENNYASRLCLGIDKEREGIVMFEPDMVAGTEFQLMYRSLDLDYMQPKIEGIFDRLKGRKPVFAMYIDCAGRCAGYGGMDIEDAVALRKIVADRVPLLGLYTGVEIARIGGQPRGLDWTGVFCLFSEKDPASRDEADFLNDTAVSAWTGDGSCPGLAGTEKIPLEALLRISEQNAAKILALDTQSIAIRHELEQKRRGFSLLAELAVSLRHDVVGYESVFVPVAQRINAALNMQRTVVLAPDNSGLYMPVVLQGYSAEEKAALAGLRVALAPELLDPATPQLVTGADPPDKLPELRKALLLPFLISSPVILKNKVAAILITGRMVEAAPFFSRLGRSDVETVQALSALLASVLVSRRLAAEEERSRIMLDAMPMCCVFWDEHGNLTDCNQEALRLFGLGSKGEFLRRFYKLAPEFQPDGRPSESTTRELVLKAFVSGSEKFEWTYMTSEGGLVPSEVTLVRAPRGEDYIMAGYIRDLREQHQALAGLNEARELAERNARAKSEFLAAVSHEIRTPMNAILAMARAVSEIETAARQQNLIEQGLNSVRLLTTALDSILDFSRIDSGQLTLDITDFSIRGMVENIAKMLRSEAESKSITLRTEVAPDVPDVLIGDFTRLEQALFKIAANSVKFTQAGGAEIRVFVGEPDMSAQGQEKVRVIFEVRDTGVGISEEQMSAIFTPFTQGETVYTRKYGGLGMGLAISRGLVTLMGGEITCESQLGQGSVFSINVPLAVPQDDSRTEADAEEGGFDELAGMRALVAEDNVINQMIVEELLSVVGIEVIIAENGLEALRELKNGFFDVVLMDIQMPEMDGLTATAQIRADHSYDDMPVLAMTANAAPEHREESLKCGMNDHLTKPIDVNELYSALKRYGKRKRREG
jgi:signal transduction histidine kinase/ActR/RegA family two-component response regulator